MQAVGETGCGAKTGAMMSFQYAGSAAIVTDAMCKAILEYATTLATNGRYGVAEFHTFADDGVAISMKVFLGSGSQLWFAEVAGTHPAFDDQLAVEEIRRKIHELTASQTHQYVGPEQRGFEDLEMYLDYI